MITRVMFDGLIILGVFLAPWWLITALLVLGMFYFAYFLESVLFALMLDILYGAHLLSPPIPWITVGVTLFFILTTTLQGSFRSL